MDSAPGSIVFDRDARVLVATIFSMLAVVVANTTSGAVVQPAISDEFQAGPADVGWIVFGYSAAFATMTAAYGALARRFGVGRCLTVAVIVVAAGAAAAVMAVNLPMLIVARVVQGLGAGAIPTLSVALIAMRLSGPARARAIGFNVAAVGVGFAAGPLIGGIALETLGWRGAMAIGLLIIPAAPIVWRIGRHRGNPAAPLDGLGMVLLAGTVGCLILLVNRLPVLGLTALTAVALIGLIVLGGWLVLHSSRRHDAALPIDLLGDRPLARVMMLGFVGQTAFLGMLVIVPVAAARVHGVDGFGLGLLLLPMAGLIAALSPRNGDVEARIGRPATTSLSLLLIAGAALFLTVVGGSTAPPVMLAALIVAGAGFSILNAPLINEVTRLCPGERRSVALGIYNLAFFLGAATGGAITTAMVQAGIELAPLAGRPLPGFSLGLLMVAIIPAALGGWGMLRIFAARACAVS